MKDASAIAILGPTGSGKTALAFELARRSGAGEVVNLDKTFIFKRFPIASGLVDSLREPGVERHLFELREPDQAIIPPEVYAEMVENACHEIGSRGGLAVIEGGSTTYVPAFLERNREARFCRTIIGLGPPAHLREKVLKRIETALSEGLLEEVREGLKTYRDTLMMTDAHAIVPLVRHLDGVISLDDAKREIADRCVAYAERQMQAFARYPEITWLEFGETSVSERAERVLALCS